MMRLIALILMSWLLVAGSALAATAELQDPMRPPMAVQRVIDQRTGNAPADPATHGAGMAQPRSNGPATAGPAGDAAEPRSKAPVAPSRARVSAVVLADRPGRDAALLDGRIAYVGDKVAGGTVARIDTQGVTLKDAKGRLSLVPLIVRAAASEAPAAAGSAPAAAPVIPPSGALAPGKELP